MFRSIIFVTLGNYGIGYGTFSFGKLIGTQNVHLANVPDVKNILLSNSFFKQVEMLDFNAEAN